MNIDKENKSIANISHNIGIMRGLYYAYDQLIEVLTTNGEPNNEAEKQTQEVLIELGKTINRKIKELSAVTGLPAFDDYKAL